MVTRVPTPQRAAAVAPAIAGFRRTEVAVEGVRLTVYRGEPANSADAPGGPVTPALLLHGIPQTALVWRHLGPELAVDRVVLAPDLKGLGSSEIAPPYDVATLTAELAALVLREVDGPVDVVGHDWGGVLALGLAGTRPELVRRLVVINAPYHTVDLLHAPHMPFFALPVLPELALRAAGRRVVPGLLRWGWGAGNAPPAVVVDAYVQAYADPARHGAMLGYYRAAMRHPRRLPDVPAERKLVIWGAADRVLPVGRVGTSVATDLGPDTTLVTLPGVGHWPIEEAPELVRRTVTDFLDADQPS
jgi:pimeloyl-ACP methyl ester carboxylesterase